MLSFSALHQHLLSNSINNLAKKKIKKNKQHFQAREIDLDRRKRNNSGF